uniref:Secreted protein n=1 Tax=Panagrellus redivivus TaxID=6233 RepID=A0A7E4WCX5_PANRE
MNFPIIICRQIFVFRFAPKCDATAFCLSNLHSPSIITHTYLHTLSHDRRDSTPPTFLGLQLSVTSALLPFLDGMVGFSNLGVLEFE